MSHLTRSDGREPAGSLTLAIDAARAAGDLLAQRRPGAARVRDDSGRDLKLAADIEAETVLLDILQRGSPHPVLSEEAGESSGLDPDGLFWAVDPLDGTLNYGRGLPLCCVSVALWRGAVPVLGVVYDFNCGVLYRGVVGEGAYRNDQPVCPTPATEVNQAVLATGFPAAGDFRDDAMAAFVDRARRYKKVRLLGSAALSLAHVASGVLDAYCEDGIQFWDVAAGLALVAAAGGRFEMKSGASRWQRRVAATNALLPLP